MKASASISIGDWYKSVDVELDSASESDVKFSKAVLSTIVEIKEKPQKITINIDGSEIAKTIKEALDSAFADDAN